ncbi:MAG: flavin reductase family protein [Pseudorhodobacter sp.]|nr:flavin reductase family protein [Pseudorhodobacter sp.]
MTETVFSPDAENGRVFRDALGRFATGVTVVTMAGPEGPLGFTANSFASVSLDPALVLWSPSKTASRYPFFAAAQHYAIHVLAIEQAGLCRRFARGGAGFAGLDPAVNPEGVPLLADTLARFDCARHEAHDGGDHLIIVGRVIRCTLRTGAPLLFSQGGYGGFIHGG